MSFITFQDGRVVFRDGKVGTGFECCCDRDDEGCPESCEDDLTVTASVGGMTATVVVPIPGGGSARFNKNDGSGDYIEVTASIACGPFGPGDALAWAVSVGVCYQSGGFLNGDTFGSVVAIGPGNCPEPGDVGLVCIPFGCVSTATGTIG